MRNKYFWAAILWTLFVTVACLVSADNFNDFEKIEMPAKDKFLHFIFYLVFTILWNSGLRAFFPEDYKRRSWAFAIAVGYGILIEICQGTLTDRTADSTDALANTAGSAMAILVLWRYQKRKLNKRSPAY